jgi:hypothetical protein
VDDAVDVDVAVAEEVAYADGVWNDDAEMVSVAEPEDELVAVAVDEGVVVDVDVPDGVAEADDEAVLVEVDEDVAVVVGNAEAEDDDEDVDVAVAVADVVAEVVLVDVGDAEVVDVAVADAVGDDDAVLVKVGNDEAEAVAVADAVAVGTGTCSTYTPVYHTLTRSWPPGPITTGERIHFWYGPTLMVQSVLPLAGSSDMMFPSSVPTMTAPAPYEDAARENACTSGARPTLVLHNCVPVAALSALILGMLTPSFRSPKKRTPPTSANCDVQPWMAVVDQMIEPAFASMAKRGPP